MLLGSKGRSETDEGGDSTVGGGTRGSSTGRDISEGEYIANRETQFRALLELDERDEDLGAYPSLMAMRYQEVTRVVLLQPTRNRTAQMR